MKYALIICSLLFPLSAFAQFTGIPAKDPGLLGQYKRMVGTRWDDWRPDPSWHNVWYPPFWMPRNAEGSAFWGLANRKYWKGKDRRPMRMGGPFEGHLLAAKAQQKLAEKVKDTVTETMKKSLATDVSMEGGVADVPWILYFKDKFKRLFDKANSTLKNVELKYPNQWSKMMNEPKETTKQLQEYFKITKDRINTIHKSYVDRGARMISYFKILKTLEGKVDFTVAYCNTNIRMANLPSREKIASADSTMNIPVNDQEAVRQILKNWDF